VLNLLTKASLLLHITIKCTSSIWCNYERGPCEDKTVCNWNFWLQYQHCFV